jgi:uncharacterized protein YceK
MRRLLVVLAAASLSGCNSSTTPSSSSAIYSGTWAGTVTNNNAPTTAGNFTSGSIRLVITDEGNYTGDAGRFNLSGSWSLTFPSSPALNDSGIITPSTGNKNPSNANLNMTYSDDQSHCVYSASVTLSGSSMTGNLSQNPLICAGKSKSGVVVSGLGAAISVTKQ